MTIRYLWSKFFKKLRGSSIKNSSIHTTSKIESGCQVINSVFKKHSFCGYDCKILDTDIGAFCSIANNVFIGGRDHPFDWVSTSPVFYKGRDSVKTKFSIHERKPIIRTTIKNDVWIGHGAFIKQGVTVGNGSVIGMGSIVTKDIEDFAVVAGCPAKTIKYRFDQETIKELLATEWWNFSDEKIKKYAKHFTEPSEFLRRIKK